MMNGLPPLAARSPGRGGCCRPSATDENPNGSCETVLRGGSAGPGGADREDCPQDGQRGGGRMRPRAIQRRLLVAELITQR
jgi:hypothetical protein